jgi:hypothetical protein
LPFVSLSELGLSGKEGGLDFNSRRDNRSGEYD